MDRSWWHYWLQLKGWIEDDLSVATDHLHVHLGLALFLVFAVALRKRQHGLCMAWLVVALLQGFNELLDARIWVRWTGAVNWSEALHDTILTMFWPTVLLGIWKWLGRPAPLA